MFTRVKSYILLSNKTKTMSGINLSVLFFCSILRVIWRPWLLKKRRKRIKMRMTLRKHPPRARGRGNLRLVGVMLLLIYIDID